MEDETDYKTFQNFWISYVFMPVNLRTKFDKKAVRCIFVGYDDERKGWMCYDPTTGRIYTSKNVVFDEVSAWWPSKDMIQSNLGRPKVRDEGVTWEDLEATSEEDKSPTSSKTKSS